MFSITIVLITIARLGAFLGNTLDKTGIARLGCKALTETGYDKCYLASLLCHSPVTADIPVLETSITTDLIVAPCKDLVVFRRWDEIVAASLVTVPEPEAEPLYTGPKDLVVFRSLDDWLLEMHSQVDAPSANPFDAEVVYKPLPAFCFRPGWLSCDDLDHEIVYTGVSVNVPAVATSVVEDDVDPQLCGLQFLFVLLENATDSFIALAGPVATLCGELAVTILHFLFISRWILFLVYITSWLLVITSVLGATWTCYLIWSSSGKTCDAKVTETCATATAPKPEPELSTTEPDTAAQEEEAPEDNTPMLYISVVPKTHTKRGNPILRPRGPDPVTLHDDFYYGRRMADYKDEAPPAPQKKSCKPIAPAVLKKDPNQ